MKTQLMTDNELVVQFVNGDAQAIETLIHRYKNKVYTYILLTVRDQQLAEDIFQDTFLKVIKSLTEGRYQENGRFLQWVMRIAHNLVIDYYRREKQMNTVSSEKYEFDLFNSQKFSDQTIEDEIIDFQINKDIRRLVDELPDDQKEIILLRHYGGLSFKEIADQTNVSINTALGRMRYALINLRKIIKDNNISLTK
ncbi:MAG TPA: sigma-70 family RNA polymerase sigma factor [Bacteroidales bacterium]|nr:sigma-70 family RNA polymerase sigma factor [Bacteroidales bacterium]